MWQFIVILLAKGLTKKNVLSVFPRNIVGQLSRTCPEERVNSGRDSAAM